MQAGLEDILDAAIAQPRMHGAGEAMAFAALAAVAVAEQREILTDLIVARHQRARHFRP